MNYIHQNEPLNMIPGRHFLPAGFLSTLLVKQDLKLYLFYDDRSCCHEPRDKNGDHQRTQVNAPGLAIEPD